MSYFLPDNVLFWVCYCKLCPRVSMSGRGSWYVKQSGQFWCHISVDKILEIAENFATFRLLIRRIIDRFGFYSRQTNFISKSLSELEMYFFARFVSLSRIFIVIEIVNHFILFSGTCLMVGRMTKTKEQSKRPVVQML